MSKMSGKLPHWDMGVVYAGLDSADFTADFDQFRQRITDLTALFDEQGIDRTEPAELDPATVALFEKVIEHFNQLLETAQTLRGYIYSFVVTDSGNDLAQARLSELQPLMAQISLLGTRLTAWIGSLDVEALIERSAIAAAHDYPLRRADQEAKHLMSPAEEALAAELSLSGQRSWQQLHGNYTSQLIVEMELEGKPQQLALTAAQNLAHHPERDVRQRAYHAVNQTLADAAIPLAAALNAIKQETLTLTRRRGWDTPLDMALFNNAIDRPTLEAMMGTAESAFPDFHRYLKARARALEIFANVVDRGLKSGILKHLIMLQFSRHIS
jgi:oligoendopeptidase F